nr:aryl-sulfate sulfotransferase [Haloferax larsenii]
MASQSNGRVGMTLVLVGVVAVVATLGLGAAFAPDIGAATNSDDAQQARTTLVGSQGGGPGLHEDGSVYLLNDTSVSWRVADADSYFDVTKLEDGRIAAGFMHSGYEECGPYESPCTHTGYRIIDPDAEGGAQTVEEWSFPVRSRANSEVHDVEVLDSGEILMTDMDRERVFTVRDGEVTWQWNASSMYDAPADPTKTDWLHINDVDVIGEDRYLVSVRNANQLVIIERGSGVVDVINEDDDGDGKGDPEVMLRQHNPQWLGDGAVLVADSENNRIIELHENDAGDWEIAWSVRSAQGVSFRWPRDADRLPNGNTLITDSANQRIVEVNRTGTVVWSVKTDLIPYEAERLPVGETVGGPQSDAALDDEHESEEIPVLSPLLTGIRASYPLPYWLAEGHLAGVLFGLLSMCAGSGIVVRNRIDW